MKRNRDLHFNQSEMVAYAPISIIITTLAAHLYAGEPDGYTALLGIVGRLQGHAVLVEGRAIDPSLATRGLIRRLPDGTWYIGNPVNPAENFADRWHEDDHARALAFFSWVDALKRKMPNLQAKMSPRMLRENLNQMLGTAAVTKHFDVLFPSARAVEPSPRVHINRPAKPWRCE